MSHQSIPLLNLCLCYQLYQTGSAKKGGDNMKHLSQFIRFDLDSFLENKELLVLSVSDWVDFEDKTIKGTKITTVIISDDTDYNGKDGNNRFEKLVIKVPKTIDVAVDSVIVPVNATARVYGDYNNQLSVVAEDIEVVG